MAVLFKITIITASYNAVSTIEQTISSVIHQDYPNIEYIIVDGGSTDGTVEIIKKYEHYGIKWISEPDEGLYDALNKGVQMSTGDYIEIIGADDALNGPHIISRIVDVMAPDTDILCGQELLVSESAKTQRICTNVHARNRREYRGGMVPHAAMFVRRELLLRYPFDTHYRITADYKFFLQCYYDETIRIQYSDEKVAFFSLSGISSNLNKCWEENDRIYRELELPFQSPDDAYSSPIKRKIKRCLIAMGMFFLVRALWTTIDTRLGWQKHTCENKICRWCGRYE